MIISIFASIISSLHRPKYDEKRPANEIPIAIPIVAGININPEVATE